MWEVLDAVLRGLQNGSVYAMVGLGLNVIFAATGVFNFAQGELVMVGAMLGVVLWVGSGLPFWVALIAVIGTTAAIGGLTELVAIRRLANQADGILWILSTLGVAIVVKAIVTILVTKPNGEGAVRSFPPYLDAAPWQLGGLTIILQRAVLIPLAIVLTLVVWLWFRRSRVGRGLLAMAADREGAAMRGAPREGACRGRVRAGWRPGRHRRGRRGPGHPGIDRNGLRAHPQRLHRGNDRWHPEAVGTAARRRDPRHRPTAHRDLPRR